ncbi:Crp/Fnr family transcriptional regulator [bacterium]|nr:Crp/Fnr family transcriptional regulator [bacterium]
MEILDQLRSVFLFRGWPEADLNRVAVLSNLARRAKGDFLFLQDDPCAWLYVLIEGRVQMFRNLPDGREVTIHVLGPGSLVACAALFLDSSFPASARILSHEANLVAIAGPAFLELLEERPDLSRKMIGALASRISQLAQRIESRDAGSAPVRLADWLLDQPSAPDGKGHRVVRIEGSKKSLASNLGVAPETFSRALRRLAEKQLIEVRGREIVLLDPAGLMEGLDGGE